MSSWSQNAKGNYVYVFGQDDVMTVFLKRDESGWQGIYNGQITRGTLDSPEEAMQVMEQAVLYNEAGLLVHMGPTDSGWLPAKKGGFYRNCGRGLLTVKQAGTGSWYCSNDGRPVKDQWFKTPDAAMRYLDRT